MTLPRGRIVTLSPYEARQTLPVRVHTGDIIDFAFNFVRLLRIDETPAELLSAVSASGRGISVSNVEFNGRYVSMTLSGVRETGRASISIAVSTDRGRTITRSLIVNTVYEDLAIEPVIPVDPTPEFLMVVGRDDSIPESHKWGVGEWWLNAEEPPIPIVGGSISPSSHNSMTISAIRYETFYEFLEPQSLTVSFEGSASPDFFTTFENDELGSFASADAFFDYDATNNVSSWTWSIISAPGNWSPVGSTQTIRFT